MSAAVTGKPQPVMVATAAAGRRAHDSGGRIHREEDAGLQRAGGDQRHHGDKAFQQHRSIADGPARATRARSSSAWCRDEISA